MHLTCTHAVCLSLNAAHPSLHARCLSPSTGLALFCLSFDALHTPSFSLSTHLTPSCSPSPALALSSLHLTPAQARPRCQCSLLTSRLRAHLRQLLRPLIVSLRAPRPSLTALTFSLTFALTLVHTLLRSTTERHRRINPELNSGPLVERIVRRPRRRRAHCRRGAAHRQDERHIRVDAHCDDVLGRC